jgi:ParB-like chromosome segregation protein Spo0J
MNEQGFFKMALGWRKQIEQESISRAEISRREGLSRARVTQLMSLLKLPEKVQQGLLAGAPEYAGWTVRRGLREIP